MKTIFITGATSGIGLEVACNLANKGHHIIATARNLDRGQKLLDSLKSKHPTIKGKIDIVICDLSSFESIVNACNEVKSKYQYIVGYLCNILSKVIF